VCLLQMQKVEEMKGPERALLAPSPHLVSLARAISANRQEVERGRERGREREREREREIGLDVTSRVSEPPAEFPPPAFMPA